MNRCELAETYHKKGCNCCQAVLASFSDLTGMTEAESLAIGGGFGGGAGTGEMCGSATGAIMALSRIYPATIDDPVAGKNRAVAQAKEFQRRFSEKFGHVRCGDLLKTKIQANESTPAASAQQLKGRCDILIVTAVEVVEEMLKDAGK